MKKFLIILFLSIFSVSLLAQDKTWIEVQVVEVPTNTSIYYEVTQKGNIKYFIKVQDFTVSVSETNAKKFLNGQIKLELVKWYNRVTGKYKYTTRRKSSENVDLNRVFG